MDQNKTVSLDGEKVHMEESTSQPIENLLFAESIYGHLPIGIEVYDTKGVLCSINDYALRMYGVGDRSTVVNIVNLFDSPYVDEELDAKIRSGEEITLEFEYDFDRINDNAYYESSNKNSMIYEVKVTPLRNKQGAIVGHILMANDVTSAKEAEFRTEETKKNLEMAMDAAAMSSWVYDVHKKTFSPLYGDPIIKDTMSMEEMLDKLHPHDRVQVTDVFSKLINREIQYGHLTVRCYMESEQQYRSFESRMRLSSEHFGKLLIVGTEMDVTEKLQTAKKARELKAKRELAMQVSNIVHWDFDVQTQKFESYNDPINDYAGDKLLTIAELQNAIHPEDHSTFNDAIQNMLCGKNDTFNVTYRMKTKYDETWQYCNVIGVPFEEDQDGNIVRFTGFRQNISKQHQLDGELRDRNNKLELTFKTVGMSYWDFDVRSRQFQSFNDSVNDFDSGKLIIPEDYIAVTHPDDVEIVSKHLDHIIHKVDKEFNFIYRSKTKWDQDWQIYLITGIPSERDKKGNVTRYSGIRYNNTKWEKMAQDLKALKEKAELSDRLKSAFLANMSHEIRTPLNAIVGFSELMIHSEDQAEKEEYASIIQSNNELLLRLINDILDLSKIESGILDRKRERFDLKSVCTELYTMIQPKITNPNVEFRMSPGPECWIFLDRNRLKQVWMNYLTNAVKCTNSGYIRMGYTVEKGGIRFYVEDTGVGIPNEMQNRVFGRFQKLNEFAQGTGLGLAISRAIIEAAEGEVGFNSTPGSGSTFWAWIPCEVEVGEPGRSGVSELPKQQSSQSGADKKDLKILIAEDNDSNYLLVQHLLKGYNLTRVTNGADAVNAVRDSHYDFVLMDMKMPVMGGLEAVCRIREFNKEIVIIALTANAFDSDRTCALEAGCNHFLTKPLKKSQLIDLLPV